MQCGGIASESARDVLMVRQRDECLGSELSLP